MSDAVSPDDRRAFIAERRRVSVHRFDTLLSPPADPRQVSGEHFEGGGYHYYPARDQARDWLAAAGFRIEDEQEADYYWHFLLERR